ncbi:MAG: response regulator [Chloroflexota bacterium]
MTKRVTTSTTHQIISHVAEGRPDSSGIKEPANPLKTMSVPIIKTDSHAPMAETGLVSAIIAQAEGTEKDDVQDASRTTAETHATPSSQKSPVSKTQRSPSVLIIEDTTELAEVIQATLERMNMVTAHETHGNKAVVRFNAFNPDIVLLDIGLPDMTGWKFLETIKETHKGSMPVIIIITAYGDPANRLVAKLQGVYDYLIKPFTSDEVERVVSGALNSRTG